MFQAYNYGDVFPRDWAPAKSIADILQLLERSETLMADVVTLMADVAGLFKGSDTMTLVCVVSTYVGALWVARDMRVCSFLVSYILHGAWVVMYARPNPKLLLTMP